MVAVWAVHVRAASFFLDLTFAFWTLVHIFIVYPVTVQWFLIWGAWTTSMLLKFALATRLFVARCAHKILGGESAILLQNLLAVNRWTIHHVFVLSDFLILLELLIFLIALLIYYTLDILLAWFHITASLRTGKQVMSILIFNHSPIEFCEAILAKGVATFIEFLCLVDLDIFFVADSACKSVLLCWHF